MSPRAQSDRMDLQRVEIKTESIENVDFWQDMVIDIIIKNKKITGIKTALGMTIEAKCVILTNAPLNGKSMWDKKSSRARSGSLHHTEFLNH